MRLDDDAELGLARVYDASLHRLYPRLPFEEIAAGVVKSLRASVTSPFPKRGWCEPFRDVQPEEIERAERVELVM